MVYAKPGVPRPIVIPVHGDEIAVSLIKSNLRTAGITTAEYLEILEKI